jgi:hypothetical protein
LARPTVIRVADIKEPPQNIKKIAQILFSNHNKLISILVIKRAA